MGETPRIDALLENATWLRGLARQMLADRGLADDAVQETWIAALDAPADLREQRPWLARVLRNFALQQGRSEKARSRREQQVARGEGLPSTDETVARAELHAKLVAAVLALDEPYRTTILWRYFEGLSAEEIARRARIDPATVRSRVARAREKLRASLMANGGEAPERWLAALLPIGARPIAISTSIATGTLAGAGGSLMGMKLVAGVGVLALVAAVLLWRDRGASEAALAEIAASGAGLEPAKDARDTAIAAAARPGERSKATIEQAAAESVEKASAPKWHGIVLSEDGRAPIEGARITCKRSLDLSGTTPAEEAQRTQQGTRSDASGNFELPVSSDAKDGLWVAADGYFGFSLSSGDLPRDNSTPIEVVLAPLGRLELEVQDDASKPLADLPVRYSIDVNRGSQEFMWSYRRELSAGKTDSAGRLTIEGLPCAMPIGMRYGEQAWSTNFLGTVHIDPHLRVLRYPVKVARTAKILGSLARADGAPAAGVRIEWQTYPNGWGDPTRSSTSEDGHFEFAQVKPEPGELRLDVPGFEPRLLAPKVGETIDLGTIQVPDVAALGGRLVSRWLQAGRLDEALEGIEVRAFRGGRMLAEFASNEGALRRNGAEFQGSVTAGPLELLVTRGGTWYPGIPFQGEILARLELPSARTGLEIFIDANAGALEVALGEDRPASGEALNASLYVLAGEDPPERGLTMHAMPDSEGLARFAPIPPGRYRCVLGFRPRDAGSVDEIAITAGQLTRLERPSFATTSIFGTVRDGKGKPAQGVTVNTRKFAVEGMVTTDAEGRFRLEGLTPGIQTLYVRHGDLGVLEREVTALAREGTRVDLVLAGYASLIGHVTQGGAPVAGLSISAQPHRSNDTYNSITDETGTFRFERLPGCRLRFWSARDFVEVRDLAAGEVLEIDIDLSKPSTLSFLREGAPVEDLNSVHAIAFDDQVSKAPHWRTGELVHGGAEMDVPIGRVLFEVNRAALGSNRSYLALVDQPGAEVELARGTIAIRADGAWNGPLPCATLVSIEGHEVINRWGSEIVLAIEPDGDGGLRVACVPDGARVKIFGYDSRGARFETTVDVPQTRLVRWP